MRLAGHTLGTPEQTLAEALRLFRGAGLDAAEVIFQDDYRSGIPVSDPAAARSALDAACSEGVDIVGLTPYTTGLNHAEGRVRRQAMDELTAAIDTAHLLGADRIRVYAGAWRPEWTDRARHWGLLRESLEALAPVASQAGVALCVENHFGTMTQTARDTAELVRSIASPAVRVLYDQANLTFTHDEDYAEALSVQGDLIGHVHVKDLVFKDPGRPFVASETARVREDERAVSSRVVGEGVVPWREILAGLVALGYDGPLSLEYEYRWHRDDLPAPADGFRRSALHLGALLSELAAHA